MSRPPPSTFADTMAVGINPALIMVLIGSFVFFLVEVFYQGGYDGRLDFIMAMFVMGAVAVCRLSMEENASYAFMFGLPLGGLTLFAVNRFVQFSGNGFLSLLFSTLLIVATWWLAYKLTWDCTLIDERADTSDQGLLHAVGMGDQSPATANQVEEELDPALAAALTSREPAEEPSFLDQWFKRKKQPHAHGLWVIYFSVPALAIFGLGQWFVQPDSRVHTLTLLVIFVASALALLLSTSFLGLRRYLRRRNLAMPIEMAGTWMFTGAGLIVAVLLLCLLLPRPGAELAVSQPPISFSAPDLSPSRWGFGKDGQKPSPDASANSTKTDPNGTPGNQAGKSQDKSGTTGKPTSDGGQKQDSQSQKSGGQTNPMSSNSGGEKQSDEKGSSNDSQKGEKSNDKGEPSQSGKSPSNPMGEQAKSPSNEQSQNQSTSGTQPSSNPPQPTSPPLSMSSITSALGWFFKLVIYLIVAAIIAFVAWKYRQQLAEAWRKLLKELAELWARLFGSDAQSQAAEASQAEIAKLRARPFSAFTNPFARGGNVDRQEAIRYTFEALQAWGRDNGCARAASETPHEYVQRLATFAPHLSPEVATLAEYYGLAAYAKAMLPNTIAPPLQALWQKMQQGMRTAAPV